MLKYLQIYLLFISVFVFSCKQNTKPDVSHINLTINIERFDQDLYKGKSMELAQSDAFLRKKYGLFYRDYVNRIVGTPDHSSLDILEILYSDQAYTDLNKEVDSIYKDLKPVETELTQSFKYVRYYYPNSRIPRFISFLSGFEVQSPIGESYMGIGLDMFLGKDSKFYRAIVQSVPMYISRRFSPDYIVPRTIETYAREELFPERDEDRSLLSKMVYNGKILYFMDKVLADDIPDSVKIGYTSKQLGWCNAYEGEIWAYYLENELLFETDFQKIQVLLNEGPFTPGLGEKNSSAPKIGIWTGWQIVRKYMEKNPDVTLQELMKETDPQIILNGAKYKP